MTLAANIKSTVSIGGLKDGQEEDVVINRSVPVSTDSNCICSF